MSFIHIFDDISDQILLINNQGQIIYANVAAKSYIENSESLAENGFNVLNEILQSMAVSSETSVTTYRENIEDENLVYEVTIRRCYSLFFIQFNSIHHKAVHTSMSLVEPQREAIFDYSMKHLDTSFHVLEKIIMELNASGNSALSMRLLDYQYRIKNTIETYYSLTSSPQQILDKPRLNVVK